MSRRTVGIALAASLMAAANSAFADGLDVRVGGFFPRGGETLFSDLHELYAPSADADDGVGRSDFVGAFGGIEYNTLVTSYLELGVHLDGYGREVDTSYRHYEWADGGEIEQELRFGSVPLGVTLRLLPTAKSQRLAPYVGAGADLVFYSYEEEGDLIDFYSEDLDVYDDEIESNGATLGVHAVVGLRVYLNRDFAIVGEGRYQWTTVQMDDDFSREATGYKQRIDLSGASFTIGLHVRF